MGRRPFEIVAECEMTGFPMAADIERIRAQIEKARKSQPDVVRVAVSSPAIYRDRLYVLDTRFLVWAEDGSGASRAVGELLKAAGVKCRAVVPSGRAIAEAEVSAPAKAAKAAKPAPAPRSGKDRRAPAAAPKRTTRRTTKRTTKPSAKRTTKRTAGRPTGRKRRSR